MKLFEKSALITAARVAKKPIAFLVGAPISNENGSGVPGVAEIIDCVRQEIAELADWELPAFEAEIAGKNGSDAYQSAMTWVQGYLLQDAVNSVISRAVLQARKPKAVKEFTEDGVPEDWNIPAGIHQLAWLTCQYREQFPGPILTTNFDPLLSLAINANGGNPVLRVVLADGNLTYNVKQAGQIEVVHLHGYWRGTDTMHTPGQLTASRPRLKESLKSILHKHTLIVVAYGGWDDVFAQALAEAVQDNATDINVLWCFRGNDISEIQRSNPALFDRIGPLLISGRFNAYGNINCHSIFEEIAAALSSKKVEGGNDNVALSPLLGWQLLSMPYLEKIASLTSEEIIRYFDGAIPSLRHALSKDIPKREKTIELIEYLSRLVVSDDRNHLQLIRAAGGEGKTTMLLQVAVEAVRTGKWKVVWRNSSQEGLPLADIEKLSKEHKWLIVADDADNIVDQIAEAAHRLHELGSKHVCFLIASRDVDWRNAKGDKKPWEQWIIKEPDYFLRSISSDDAKLIVKAWSKFGDEGLRSLAGIGKLPQKALELIKAVWDEAEGQEKFIWGKPSDGSFFGGLLAVRFGHSGLRTHVLEFLKRLDNMLIENSTNGSTLLDALLYIAACHGTGVAGLDSRVLADLVGVPRDWVQSMVVRPLGAEAGTVDSGGHVFTRHSKVAAAIIIEAELSLGKDFAEVWARLVRQTAEAGRDVYYDSRSYRNIMNAGPRIQENLPNELEIARRKGIAISAARAAMEYDHEHIIPITTLGKTYRLAKEYKQAVDLFREKYRAIPDKSDFVERVRGYVTEWSISESEEGVERNKVLVGAALLGFSISDSLNPSPITNDDIRMIGSSLGNTFIKLARIKGSIIDVYAKAVRAATYLTRQVDTIDEGEVYFKRHERISNEMGTPETADPAEAIEWLKAGIYQIGVELRDSFILDISTPTLLSFSHLSAAIGKN